MLQTRPKPKEKEASSSPVLPPVPSSSSSASSQTKAPQKKTASPLASLFSSLFQGVTQAIKAAETLIVKIFLATNKTRFRLKALEKIVELYIELFKQANASSTELGDVEINEAAIDEQDDERTIVSEIIHMLNFLYRVTYAAFLFQRDNAVLYLSKEEAAVEYKFELLSTLLLSLRDPAVAASSNTMAGKQAASPIHYSSFRRDLFDILKELDFAHFYTQFKEQEVSSYSMENLKTEASCKTFQQHIRYNLYSPTDDLIEKATAELDNSKEHILVRNKRIHEWNEKLATLKKKQREMSTNSRALPSGATLEEVAKLREDIEARIETLKSEREIHRQRWANAVEYMNNISKFSEVSIRIGKLYDYLVMYLVLFRDTIQNYLQEQQQQRPTTSRNNSCATNLTLMKINLELEHIQIVQEKLHKALDDVLHFQPSGGQASQLYPNLAEKLKQVEYVEQELIRILVQHRLAEHYFKAGFSPIAYARDEDAEWMEWNPHFAGNGNVAISKKQKLEMKQNLAHEYILSRPEQSDVVLRTYK